MGPKTLCGVLLAVVFSLQASAGVAAPGCVGIPGLLLCQDGAGNSYSLVSSGGDTYTHGLPTPGSRRWVQTASRYGQLTIFSGVASDSEVWLGRMQKVGWSTLSRVSSSRGGSQSVRCNRITGCREIQARAFSLILAR
ncbi:MAG: glutamine synthetase [Pseudomonas sp.]